MIAKLVRKQLKSVHDSLLESIEDNNVKRLLEENSIITGGSIVSLLTNQPVNDYDIYLTNRKTCKCVAQYYIDKFIENTKDKLNKDPRTHSVILPELIADDDRIKIKIKSEGVASETGTGSKAYEFFESSPDEEAAEFIDNMSSILDNAGIIPAKDIDCNNKADIPKKYRPIFLTSNAITLSDKVQIIIRFYGKPEKIHSSYDFVHCMNYWSSGDNNLVLSKDALQAILTKQLVYIGSLYPIASMIRIRKFIKKGYSINAGQILKIAFQISELDLTDVSVLEDQLIGVDNAYFIQLIGYLKERVSTDDQFRVTMGYLESIVDKVF